MIVLLPHTMGIDFLARLKIGSRKSTVVRESQCTFRNDGACMVKRNRGTEKQWKYTTAKQKNRMSTRTCTNEHKTNRTNKEQQTTILGGAQFKYKNTKYKFQIPNKKQEKIPK